MNTSFIIKNKPLYRVFSVVLAIITLFTATAFYTVPNAKALSDDFKCGDNLTWSLDDGVLTISGSGDMYDYTTETTEPASPWYKHKDEITSLNIESGVKSIGGAAFYGCALLSDAVIPDSIDYIGNYAFNNTAIIKDKSRYESGVLYIGNHLIKADSESLPSEYKVKEGTLTIAGGAFASCTALRSVEMVDTVKAICDYAFYFCPGISTVTIPDSVTTIYERAFGDCIALNTLILGNGVKTIGEYAFSSCLRLEELIIPQNVKVIGEAAFCNCTGLKNISFGTGLNEIGESAFYNCTSLASVDIPGNVALINDGAFYACSMLESVNIESGVKTIGIYAFSDCETLTSAVIPNSVREIKEQAFYNCNNLLIKCGAESAAERFAIEYNINYETINAPVILKEGTCGDDLNWTFDDNGKLHISGNGKMNEFLYASDAPWVDLKDDISSVVIDEGVTSVSDWAFSFCYGLKKLSLPLSVTSVGYKSFCGSGLTSVYISENLTTISNFAFACPDVREINVSKDNINYSSDDKGVLFNKDKTTLIQYPRGSYEFEYIVPNTVKVIEKWAFEACKSLQTVIIPASVKNINNRAFSSCKVLQQVIISNGMESIGDWAFFECEMLNSVTLPPSITYLGLESFGYDLNEKQENFVIKCFEDTVAMQYATQNEFDLVVLDGVVLTENASFTLDGELLSEISPDTDITGFADSFVSEIVVKDAKGNEISDGVICTGYTVNSGDETLTLIVKGDANGDGASDSSDASCALRHDAGIAELDTIYKKAADTNGDGDADSSDAALILKADAGLI